MPGLARRMSFHALTVLAVLVCVVAARWQWDRAHRTEADAVPEVAAVGLASLDPEQAYSGMIVALHGQFDPAAQVLVEPRMRAGQPGAWVLTPMVTAEGAVGVVRGWIPAGADPGPPPSGTVEVVAVLIADVRRPEAAVAPGDPPTMAVVDTGALESLAGYPVRSGWFALQEMTPTDPGGPMPLEVTELPGADVGLNWRNAAYAVQWIVFAGFAAFFWVRFRREHVRPEGPADARPHDREHRL